MKKLKIFLFLICLLVLLLIMNFIFKNKKSDNIKYFQLKNIKNTKVCICTFGKEENRYIREFILHYEKYGVDKIFLYDNNDINGERFEDVIKDYIEKGFVKIFNFRGKKKCRYKMMNDCYKLNYEKYSWLIFYELDEFIHLYNYTNIKYFLNEKKFKNCQIIHLNLVLHTDNDLLYYENKSLAERFPKIVSNTETRQLEVKYILRGHIPNIRIAGAHNCDKKLKKKCNGFGHKNKVKGIFATEPDFKYYYIDHYYSKSTEEFINKINRGDPWKSDKKYYMHKVKKYYLQNNFTRKKIEMIENGTGLNLTKYKKMLGFM